MKQFAFIKYPLQPCTVGLKKIIFGLLNIKAKNILILIPYKDHSILAIEFDKSLFSDNMLFIVGFLHP